MPHHFLEPQDLNVIMRPLTPKLIQAIPKTNLLITECMDMKTAETSSILEATHSTQSQTLRKAVSQTLESYFSHLDGHAPTQLYDLVMEEVEPPLLEAVLRYTRGNQCKAAMVLGISRGTLRKKLKAYNMERFQG